MCPRQWEVMSTVLVCGTWFLGHTLCALNDLLEVTSSHPVSPPGAVTEAGSICVPAQPHTTLQMMSDPNLLVPSKAETSCLHHLS